jgi:hypothetical protein
MKKFLIGLLILGLSCLVAKPVYAFCGFYVAKADAGLYNRASQVVIARDGDRTVLTMANDYQGEIKDFALVVPVPTVITEEQVHVSEAKIIERLDAFSAPRLVEYFDENPCDRSRVLERMDQAVPAAPTMTREARRDNSLGVTIEEKFTVGEYDILVLSARQSDGLEKWLRQNGYKLPKGASQLLQPYIRQGLKFFVAKVNLTEFSKTGFASLRPIQIAYESRRFMLPIRLGMMNSQGEQDLIVYLLSPKGQTEVTNYRTVKIPSNVEVPEFIQKEFKDFYTGLFQRSYERENKKVAFLEYAWDMGNCDPCSAEPLSREELKQAGVFWSDSGQVFVTRLHVRYTREKFPEDLRFQETANQELFQGRYVLRHPYRGNIDCSAGGNYRSTVRQRQEEEARTLARLTGWNIDKIRGKIDFFKEESMPWWRKLWRSMWGLGTF